MSAGRAEARSLVMLLLAAFAFVPAARSEEIRLVEGPVFEADLGASYRNWTLKKEGSEDVEVSEAVLPISARMRLGRRAEVSVFFPGVSARLLGEDGSHYRGPADATISGSYVIGGRTRVGLLLGVPTGRSDPEPDERTIAAVAASRILRFPVRRFGEGFDVGGNLVHGFPLAGSFALSAGGGFLRKGEYTYAGSGGETEYDPGDEAFLSCGAEGEWGRGTRVSLAADLRYRLFGVDRRGGEDYYEEGDEVDLFIDAAARFRWGGRAAIGVFFAFKGEGSEEGAFGIGEIDSLTVPRYLFRDLTGDCREVSASYEHPVHRRVGLAARVLAADFGEYSVPEGAETEGARLLGSARVYEAGGGLRVELAPGIRLFVDAARLAGDAEDGAIELSGYELTTALHWTY